MPLESRVICASPTELSGLGRTLFRQLERAGLASPDDYKVRDHLARVGRPVRVEHLAVWHEKLGRMLDTSREDLGLTADPQQQVDMAWAEVAYLSLAPFVSDQSADIWRRGGQPVERIFKTLDTDEVSGDYYVRLSTALIIAQKVSDVYAQAGLTDQKQAVLEFTTLRTKEILKFLGFTTLDDYESISLEQLQQCAPQALIHWAEATLRTSDSENVTLSFQPQVGQTVTMTSSARGDYLILKQALDAASSAQKIYLLQAEHAGGNRLAYVRKSYRAATVAFQLAVKADLRSAPEIYLAQVEPVLRELCLNQPGEGMRGILNLLQHVDQLQAIFSKIAGMEKATREYVNFRKHLIAASKSPAARSSSSSMHINNYLSGVSSLFKQYVKISCRHSKLSRSLSITWCFKTTDPGSQLAVTLAKVLELQMKPSFNAPYALETHHAGHIFVPPVLPHQDLPVVRSTALKYSNRPVARG